jgi:long-chain fatty acid transport protein
MGAKARGMGGIGIGMSHGAESALANPALITSVNGTEVSFGGTVFMPDVKTDMGAGFSKSSADLSVIPEVAIAQKASDTFYWGIGMFGVAGMGTDYRDATGYTSNLNMVTNLQLMQFAVPLAYKSNGFSIGVAPVLQYGSLDMNYDASGMPSYTSAVPGKSSTQGVAQDFGFGYNIGAAYEMSGLTVGASYKSAIDMSYKGQLSKATADFASWGYLAGAMADNLEQPAEIGVGASYKMGANTFAIDYKQIKWSDAKGYKDFGWENQNVIILGYEFAQKDWALRAGYNHAKSPIKEANPMAPGGSAMNMLNLLGFPAMVEDHYTVGGSLAFNKMTSVDLAYVYTPEASDKFAVGSGSIETKHSQQGVTAQLNFNF